jgi:hypothetical protein
MAMGGRASRGIGIFRSTGGSVTVEFVAFAPLLIAALVFAYEFGRAFWAFDVVTRDVRAGARYIARMAVPPAPDTCPPTAENFIQTGSPVDASDASRHFPWKGVSATFTCSSADFVDDLQHYNVDGQVVTITASVPLTLSLLDFINSFLSLSSEDSIPLPYSLTVSYQARYVGN